MKLILILLAIGCLMACKKNYTCECTNPGGVYATYKLNGSKEKAKKTCDKYNTEANSIPWSESFCSLK